MAMRSAPDPSGGFVKVATTTTITTTTTTVEGVGDRAAEVAEALLEVTRLKVELKEQSVEQEELREMLRARVQEVHDEAQARLMALDEKDKVQAALVLLASVPSATVTFETGDVACAASPGVSMAITFTAHVRNRASRQQGVELRGDGGDAG